MNLYFTRKVQSRWQYSNRVLNGCVELLRFCAFFVNAKNAKAPPITYPLSPTTYHLTLITCHLPPMTYHLSPTTSPETMFFVGRILSLPMKRSEQGSEDYPLRERSDRMGEGPRAQRTGVWVFSFFATFLIRIASAAVSARIAGYGDLSETVIARKLATVAISQFCLTRSAKMRLPRPLPNQFHHNPNGNPAKISR